MMRLMLFALCLFARSGVAAEPATLKARAALALAFAAPPVPPTYADRYAAAVRDGKPLVVWVGQPARPVPGCVSVRVGEFPGAEPVAVVVGVPAGPAFHRVDLPGRPTDAAVQTAVAAARQGPDPATAMLPAK